MTSNLDEEMAECQQHLAALVRLAYDYADHNDLDIHDAHEDESVRRDKSPVIEVRSQAVVYAIKGPAPNSMEALEEPEVKNDETADKLAAIVKRTEKVFTKTCRFPLERNSECGTDKVGEGKAVEVTGLTFDERGELHEVTETVEVHTTNHERHKAAAEKVAAALGGEVRKCSTCDSYSSPRGKDWCVLHQSSIPADWVSKGCPQWSESGCPF